VSLLAEVRRTGHPLFLRLRWRPRDNAPERASPAPERAPGVPERLPELLRDGPALLRPRLLRAPPPAGRTALGWSALGIPAASHRAALLREGGDRGPHSPAERRDPGSGLPQVHRHLLPRRRLVDGPGG